MRTVATGVLLLSLTIVFFGAGFQIQAQQQKPAKVNEQELPEDDVVRVNTNLVTVPVSVMDRQGRFIPDLDQGPFHLYENGVEQEIAHFDSAEKPFTVALLLDTSDSTRFKFKDIQDAAIAFTEQLRPDDRVMVAAFDKRVTMLTEATSDRRVLQDAIRRARTGGGTSLYQAVEVIVGERLNRVRGRKAMVLFTDGVDTTSLGATYERTLHQAQELDALVYAIQYHTYDDAMSQSVSSGALNTQVTTSKGESLQTAYARGNRYLNLMAARTGGRFYYADTLRRLTEVFTHIAQELRQQYSIGYYPKNQLVNTEQRQLKVQVSLPGVVVRARRSYLFKPAHGKPEKQ